MLKPRRRNSDAHPVEHARAVLDQRDDGVLHRILSHSVGEASLRAPPPSGASTV